VDLRKFGGGGKSPKHLGIFHDLGGDFTLTNIFHRAIGERSIEEPFSKGPQGSPEIALPM
jgi:hypothetical protein